MAHSRHLISATLVSEDEIKCSVSESTTALHFFLILSSQWLSLSLSSDQSSFNSHSRRSSSLRKTLPRLILQRLATQENQPCATLPAAAHQHPSLPEPLQPHHSLSSQGTSRSSSWASNALYTKAIRLNRCY